MGRIKTTLIKRTSNKIFSDNPTLFKKSFEENKVIVSSLIETKSKKFRNIIAGYVTRLAKQQEN